MGEATSMHSLLLGEGGIEGSLEDELYAILGRKRRAIAEQHIAASLGNNTHDYPAYMASLGSTLAIPGTKNIVEHLSTLHNPQQHIDAFFAARDLERYSVNTIIETVQEHVRKSEGFRNKIISWIQDQSREWNREKYELLKEHYVRRVQEVLAAPRVADPKLMEDIQAFYAVATHVMATSPNLQDVHAAENWDEFMQQILATEEAKQWMREHYAALNPLQRQLKKQEIMDACAPEILGEQLTGLKTALLNREIFDVSTLSDACAVQAKVKQIAGLYTVLDEEGDVDPERSLEPPAEATLRRLINQEPGAGLDVISDHLERARQSEFIGKCIPIFTEEAIPEGIAADGSVIPETTRITGLTKEMMEWLLVSHKILVSQAE